MANAVTKVEPAQELATANVSPMFAMIERAARDPAVDIDKLERLMQMKERADSQAARAAFDAAMADLQPELPSVGERGNAAGRYTYALWEDINAAIKPILTRHGFALTFRTDFANGIQVTGVLSHAAGHREETSITLPADASGNKNAVQAVASSVSYGKRYTAGALLNLTSHGEDDDAYAATSEVDITDWRSAIEGAADKTELDRIGKDIKAAKLPAAARKRVAALWSAKAKELAA